MTTGALVFTLILAGVVIFWVCVIAAFFLGTITP